MDSRSDINSGSQQVITRALTTSVTTKVAETKNSSISDENREPTQQEIESAIERHYEEEEREQNSNKGILSYLFSCWPARAVVDDSWPLAEIAHEIVEKQPKR